MSSPVKSVIILGAGGNLGPTILKEFLASSLNVTVLSRPDSKSTFPPEVKVLKSDYSLDSLKSAFAGQDVVISVIGAPGFTAQKTVIDAAIAAGVKRFIPSEYGCNTGSSAVTTLVPFVASKRQVVQYLQTKERSISWTALITGPFFDWCLKDGFFGFNIPEKKAAIWDGGEAPFATTNLSTVARALVCLLSRPHAFEKSNNQYVYIASHITTQMAILASLEKATGSSWTITEVNADARIKEVNKELSMGNFSSAMDLLLAVAYGKKEKLGLLPNLWNEELGLVHEDLDQVVKEVVEGKRP